MSKNLWKTYRVLFFKLFSLFGSVASLVGLLIIIFPSEKHLSGQMIALLCLAAFLLVMLVFQEIKSYQGHYVFDKSNLKGIRKYMHNWIKDGGRVAIWTRDMSWAQNDKSIAILKKKAEQNELILCLPEGNHYIEELKKAGAEICAYGANNLESPESRFTISFFGRDGARVAVGRAVGDNHVIDEFNAGSHPAFSLAEDLIALVRSQCARQK